VLSCAQVCHGSQSELDMGIGDTVKNPTNGPSQPSFAKRLALAGLNLLVPLHTGLLVAYYVASLSGGCDLWFVDAIGYVLPWLFLPTLILLPLALLLRTRIRLVLTLVPIALFVLTYGHLYLPRMPVQSAGPSFRAMAYNVLFLNDDIGRVADEIETHDPDFVGLRELIPDVAEYVGERLKDRYPYHEVDVWCGFWSRYPVLAYRSYRLGRGHGQPAQQFLLDIEGRPVTVVSVHPRSPPLRVNRPFGTLVGIPTGLDNQGRDADILDLIERLDQIQDPLVVMGDLNLTDQQVLYPALTSRLRDAHRDVGWGMGFTFTRFRELGLPMWRIDYVFHSSDLVATRAIVGDYGGSDHCPVIVDLAFAER
jgi:endonuclease/exonuclease/phosphatase (EEP) superfamily protein YafD